MVRRLLVALLCLLPLAAAATWWLGQRPLRYEERPAVAASPPLSAAAPAAPGAGAAAGAVAAMGGPSDDAPIALPVEVAVPARTERGPAPSFRRTENYLLVGVDRTRGNVLGRADSLILAVFDDSTGHVGFVSIPRDLFVEIPDYGSARINATLRIGAKLRRDPLELLRKVTSSALAVPVEHVVVVDTESFERGIDRLGGLTLHVPCPIDDNFVDPRTPTGRRLLHVPEGVQHLDGVTAAMYARSRHGRSDWDRARRQQALLLALRDRAQQVGIDEWLPIALETVEQAVTTTMSRLEMLQLARRAAGIDRDRMHGVVIGTRQTEMFRTAEGQQVLVPRYDAIDAQLARLFSAPAPGLRPQAKQCPAADVAF